MIEAVFFDRDGVLNKEVGYIWKIENFEWIDGAREAIKFCNDLGVLTVVVTNQGGIAKGLYTSKEVNGIHKFMQKELQRIGAHIDGFYFCPHHAKGTVKKFSFECNCRKPKPGLILKACKDFKLNPARVVLIGDTERDIQAAQAAGIKSGVLFTTGNLLEIVKRELKNND